MPARDRDAVKPVHGAVRHGRTPVNQSTQQQLKNGAKTPAEVRRDSVNPIRVER
jgi:hypothetical protein